MLNSIAWDLIPAEKYFSNFWGKPLSLEYRKIRWISIFSSTFPYEHSGIRVPFHHYSKQWILINDISGTRKIPTFLACRSPSDIWVSYFGGTNTKMPPRSLLEEMSRMCQRMSGQLLVCAQQDISTEEIEGFLDNNLPGRKKKLSTNITSQ